MYLNVIIPLQKCSRLVANTKNFSTSLWCFKTKFITDGLGYIGMNGTTETTVRCNGNDQLVVSSAFLSFGGTRLIEKGLEKYRTRTENQIQARSCNKVWLQTNMLVRQNTLTPSPYGRAWRSSRSALAYFAADTIFMDCVIFWMFVTDLRRIWICFRVAMERFCCWAVAAPFLQTTKMAENVIIALDRCRRACAAAAVQNTRAVHRGRSGLHKGEKMS